MKRLSLMSVAILTVAMLVPDAAEAQRRRGGNGPIGGNRSGGIRQGGGNANRSFSPPSRNVAPRNNTPRNFSPPSNAQRSSGQIQQRVQRPTQSPIQRPNQGANAPQPGQQLRNRIDNAAPRSQQNLPNQGGLNADALRNRAGNSGALQNRDGALQNRDGALQNRLQGQDGNRQGLDAEALRNRVQQNGQGQDRLQQIRENQAGSDRMENLRNSERLDNLRNNDRLNNLRENGQLDNLRNNERLNDLRNSERLNNLRNDERLNDLRNSDRLNSARERFNQDGSNLRDRMQNREDGRLPGLDQLRNNEQLGDRMNRSPEERQAAARERWENRPEDFEERRTNLNDRLESAQNLTPEDREDWQNHLNDSREDRQDFRNNSREDRQDFRTAGREDWQDWADSRYWPYYGWHSGYWGGGYYPGYPGGGYPWYPGARWNYYWDNYPVLSAFGVTFWGINRLAWTFGYNDYYNPYWNSGGTTIYNYSQPLVVYDTGYYPTTTTTTTAALPPSVTSAGMSALDEALVAFRQGDYDQALNYANQAVEEAPGDLVAHEFRSLALFAVGRYDESAEAIYAVLAVNPGWDWATMSSLYGTTQDYTSQLRGLESWIGAHPDSSPARFLLAYHYMRCNHNDAAATQLAKVLRLTPQNEVAADLYAAMEGPDALAQIDGFSQPADPPASPPAAQVDVTPVDVNAIMGQWTATGQNNSEFQLSLTENGQFAWTFTRDGQSQEVSGVWALEGNTLAMEPNTGGTMLAQIVPTGEDSGFTFKMLGTNPSQPGLDFQRQ